MIIDFNSVKFFSETADILAATPPAYRGEFAPEDLPPDETPAEAAPKTGETAKAKKKAPPDLSKMTPRARHLYALLTAAAIRDRTRCILKSLDEFPAYTPEAENPDILIKGRWLERGGSAFVVSTAGTGKSILSVQLSLSWAMGVPFAGLAPNLQPGSGGFRVWICQSEDSESRVTIDREDVTAELMETLPGIDWQEARRRVSFLTIGGRVGADFLAHLTLVLEIAQDRGDLPDIIVLNPFMAYIGGPVTDGAYVTPFLRGGEINHHHTNGLQHLLERFRIGALIFHHTPKPPTEKELDGWIKSAFPEYQGAGSADITNWGRSFLTMMRLKDDSRKVMLTAGKNGGEIGWETIAGATRHFLAYSDATGITGKGRHAWRELTAEELDEVKNALEKTPKSSPGRPGKDGLDIAVTARSIAANYRSDAVGRDRREFARFFWEKDGKTHRREDYEAVFDELLNNCDEYDFEPLETTKRNGRKAVVIQEK